MEQLPAPVLSPVTNRMTFAQKTGKTRPAPPPSWFHPIESPLPTRQTQYIENRPVCVFSDTEVTESAMPFAHTLILKFSKGRPTIHEIKAHIKANWNIQQEPIVALLDPRHVMVSMATQRDMLMGLSRESNKIGSSLFKVARWTQDFSFNKDSYRVGVWMKLPHLPFQYFNQPYLTVIGNTLGNFIRSDEYTKCFQSFLFARICVEMDMRQELPDSVWIGKANGEGFWQKIEYEGNTMYCVDCGLSGHSKDICWKADKRKQTQQKQEIHVQKESQKGGSQGYSQGFIRKENVWKQIPGKNGGQKQGDKEKLMPKTSEIAENPFALLELLGDVVEQSEKGDLDSQKDLVDTSTQTVGKADSSSRSKDKQTLAETEKERTTTSLLMEVDRSEELLQKVENKVETVQHESTVMILDHNGEEKTEELGTGEKEEEGDGGSDTSQLEDNRSLVSESHLAEFAHLDHGTLSDPIMSEEDSYGFKENQKLHGGSQLGSKVKKKKGRGRPKKDRSKASFKLIL